MKKSDRIKMVKAMEYIARQLNDEEIFEDWLILGVADGDIDDGDLGTDDKNSDLDYYCEDDNFSALMGLFIRLMARAKKSGGLYCDGILDDTGR